MIDLNKGLRNFTADFKVESDGPFDGVVVTQSMLDSGDIQYHEAGLHGERFLLGGQVKNDRPQYDNYYLLLKADEDVVADVSISRSELKVVTPSFSLPKWVWYAGAIGGVMVAGSYMTNRKKSVSPSLLDNLMKSVEK